MSCVRETCNSSVYGKICNIEDAFAVSNDIINKEKVLLNILQLDTSLLALFTFNHESN